MERALLITVQFHDDRYHGSGGWPPSPARLYQALVAGVARGATVTEEARDALEWLERLSPPIIATQHWKLGQHYTNFVPNNDLDAALSGKNAASIEKAVASIRTGKSVRPVLFEAPALVVYCWFFSDGDQWAKTLCKVAEQLYQFGRGIDMAWANAEILGVDEAQKRFSDHRGIIYRPSAGGGTGQNMLCPQPGTRQSLKVRFEGMRARFRPLGANRKLLFVQPSKPLFRNVAYNAPPDRLVFALRGHDAQGGFAPRRLDKAATLVTEARNQAAQRLCEVMPGWTGDVARYLIGQGATNADKPARVRILPLPSIGHDHADMMIRRLAVYVPQSCPLRTDDLAWAFAQVVWRSADNAALGELQSMENDSMTKFYERSGLHWQSVTPLALATMQRRRIDPARTRKEIKGADERAREESHAAQAVRQALRHANICVSPTAVHVQREPFDERGERAETFSVNTRFPEKALWHVSITFAEPVTGPLLLGNGRYTGLGLMRPTCPIPGVLAFMIDRGLVDDTEPALVARAARRAMLARVQDSLPQGQNISRYVSGHEDDGGPARSGDHRHITIVPDLPRKRLLFIAPNLLQRNKVKWREIAGDHARLERALDSMSILRAGKAGYLTLSPSLPDIDNDPLFVSSRIWESVSDYRVTRHRRRSSSKEALSSDVLAELRRIGWPIPTSIDVLRIECTPGSGLSGRLRLTFATARQGPLLIGRTSHKGGGLFAVASRIA